MPTAPAGAPPATPVAPPAKPEPAATPQPSGPGVVALRGTGSTFYAWLADGSVRAWGNNRGGRIDPALPERVTTPKRVAHPLDAVVADVERPLDETVCALQPGGVACFGRYAAEARAQLVGRDQPTPGAIALGRFWACAHDAGGVRCIGPASWLGVLQPGLDLRFPELADATAIAMSSQHACALRHDRTVACWGDRRHAAVDGARVSDSKARLASTPVAVAGVDDAVEIALADDLSCARIADGTLRCWGDPFYARGAVPLAGIHDATALVADGDRRVCVLAAGAPPRCLASAGEVHLGSGAGADATEQAGLLSVLIERIDVAILALNPDSACLVTTTGELLCWGTNDQGQLGDGTLTDRGTPAVVALRDG